MLFLTGLPRTGTTWAARALHAAIGGELISEPFNWKARPEREPWHMRYLPTDAPDEGFDALVHETLRPDHPTVVKEVHTPLAIERWAMAHERVVVLVRHPAAMAASWHHLGYQVRFRIEVLLGQPRLLEDHLEPFAEHLRTERDWFGDVGAYWGASYHVLRRLADGHQDWRWTSHEHLCADPHAGFAALLDGLPTDAAALERFVAETDAAPGEGDSPYETRRRTAQEPDRWRTQLDPIQVAAVLAGAAPFAAADLLGSEL